MNSSRLHVSLDQGGHSSRAIAFDSCGQIVASARREVATQRPRVGHVEQNPETLVQSLRDSLDDLCEKLGREAVRIVNIGLATQRSSLVCWNARTGEALSPVLSWQDRRAAKWLEKFEPHAGRVRELTGLFLSPHYGASKLAWCLRELPGVRGAHQAGELRMGPIASFLATRLLSESSLWVDPCNAGRTLLFDLKEGNWSSELLELFGLPREVLPTCTRTQASFGRIAASVGERPLEILSGDQPAALFAHGRPGRDVVYVNLGTGAFVLRFLEGVEQAPERMLAAVSYSNAREVRHVVEGTVNGAASALDYAADQLGIDKWEANLDAWLRESMEPSLFINGVGGVGSPFWLAVLESSWLETGSIADQMAGVAESVLFLVQCNLEEFAALEPHAKRVRVTGGLSNSDALCQRFADLCGLPVERPIVREATARGVAFWLAGEPAGWSEIAPPTIFAPNQNAGVITRYRRWLDCMNDTSS